MLWACCAPAPCLVRSAAELSCCMPAARLLRPPDYVPACCGYLLSSHTCVPAALPASECDERGRHHHLRWHQGQQGAWPPPRAQFSVSAAWGDEELSRGPAGLSAALFLRAAILAACCWTISSHPWTVLRACHSSLPSGMSKLSAPTGLSSTHVLRSAGMSMAQQH